MFRARWRAGAAPSDWVGETGRIRTDSHPRDLDDAGDIVVRATQLTKVYRLYARPLYRFLDMFGLLGARPGAFTEHAALDGVNLTIRRGEKVAIIGRNGAGKSTLLKLVTKVIEPTSGRIDVEGTVHALLQIGTGFHPDFTGRENVYAYLAQLGITGARGGHGAAPRSSSSPSSRSTSISR